MATHRPNSPIHLDSAGNESRPDEPKQTGMTAAQRQTIAIVGLVVCLLIGGGIIYWLLFATSPKQRSVKVDPTAQSADAPGGRPMIRTPPRPPQRVTKEDDTTWQVRGSSGAMRVTVDGAAVKLEPYYPGRDFLTPEQVSLVAGFVRAKRDEAMAKEWGISPEQLTKLKAIDLRGSMLELSSAESAELRQLWDSYMKASDGTAKAD